MDPNHILILILIGIFALRSVLQALGPYALFWVLIGWLLIAYSALVLLNMATFGDWARDWPLLLGLPIGGAMVVYAQNRRFEAMGETWDPLGFLSRGHARRRRQAGQEAAKAGQEAGTGAGESRRPFRKRRKDGRNWR